MRFFKKYDITKENRKLGDEYMPSGSIRVLNPYEVHKNVRTGASEPETCHAEVFKRIESRKGLRNSQEDESREKTNEQRTHNDDDDGDDSENNKSWKNQDQ